jgi:hypothetical protein
MKLTESQLKQIVKEEISKTLNEVNLPSWFVKVGHDNMRVPKEQAENAVKALELAILDRLNQPETEISDKMKRRIVKFVDDSYTVVDLSTGDKHDIEVSDSFLKTNEDLLDKYSPMFEGRNNMKLTESQLRKIIREELKAVRADQLHLTEGDFVTSSAEPDPASAAPAVREAGDLRTSIANAAKVYLGARLPVLAKANKFKLLGPGQQGEFDDIVNKVQRGELARDKAVEMISAMVHGTMDEA